MLLRFHFELSTSTRDQASSARVFLRAISEARSWIFFSAASARLHDCARSALAVARSKRAVVRSELIDWPCTHEGLKNGKTYCWRDLSWQARLFRTYNPLMSVCLKIRNSLIFYDPDSNLKCDTLPHPSEGAVRSEMSAGCCAIEPLESPLFFGISTWHRSSKVK